MAEPAAALASPNPPFNFDWEAVERGVPLSTLEDFAAYSGLTLKDLLEVVIPARTLKHRRQRQEPLSADESDRLRRVARTFDLAARIYGSAERARQWLTNPKRRFKERAPISLLRTQAGEHAVEEFLIQIDEGIFL